MYPSTRIVVAPAMSGCISTLSIRELGRRIRKAARRQGIARAGFEQLGIRIVDDTEMAALHLRYMGETGPTDVLSFGPGADLGPDPDGGGRDGLLFGSGDLALNWEAVRRQAPVQTAAGHLDEATLLAIHGLAHLTGHDHRTRTEGRRMHRDECRMLRCVQVADQPRPYVLGVQGPSPGHRIGPWSRDPCSH